MQRITHSNHSDVHALYALRLKTLLSFLLATFFYSHQLPLVYRYICSICSLLCDMCISRSQRAHVQRSLPINLMRTYFHHRNQNKQEIRCTSVCSSVHIPLRSTCQKLNQCQSMRFSYALNFSLLLFCNIVHGIYRRSSKRWKWTNNMEMFCFFFFFFILFLFSPRFHRIVVSISTTSILKCRCKFKLRHEND